MSVVHIIFVSLNLKVYTTTDGGGGGGGKGVLKGFVWVGGHHGVYYKQKVQVIKN